MHYSELSPSNLVPRYLKHNIYISQSIILSDLNIINSKKSNGKY